MIEIIQGSNDPIIIEMDEDISDIEKISVGLYSSSTRVKQWDIDDIGIESTVMSCPLTQTETAALTGISYTLSVKMYDSNDKVLFFDEESVRIVPRKDKAIIFEADDTTAEDTTGEDH